MTGAGNTPISRQLEELLDCGRQMLAAARAGDWDRTSERQADCHRLAAAVFSRPVEHADATAVAGAIVELKELHDAVMQLCHAAREQSMQEIGEMNQGRQAVSEYSSNSE